jgi:hypothetical protein
MEININELKSYLNKMTAEQKKEFLLGLLDILMENLKDYSVEDISRLSGFIQQNKDVIGEGAEMFQEKLKKQHLTLISNFSEPVKANVLKFV